MLPASKSEKHIAEGIGFPLSLTMENIFCFAAFFIENKQKNPKYITPLKKKCLNFKVNSKWGLVVLVQHASHFTCRFRQAAHAGKTWQTHRALLGETRQAAKGSGNTSHHFNGPYLLKCSPLTNCLIWNEKQTCLVLQLFFIDQWLKKVTKNLKAQRLHEINFCAVWLKTRRNKNNNHTGTES